MAWNEQRNNQNRPQMPKPKPNILSDYKLRLRAPLAEGQQKASTLKLSVWQNQPRFEVTTNLSTDRVDRPISAKLNVLACYALMTLIVRMTKADPGTQEILVNNTGRPGELVHDTRIRVGKDTEGRVYMIIEALSSERPKIKFPFLPDDWHMFLHKDGSTWDAGELSCLYAEGYVKAMGDLLTTVLHDEYVEPDWSSSPRQGGQNNQQHGSGQRHQAQSSKADYDDDLPF